MRALLDVNLLIALHDGSHVHHATASSWFQANVGTGWASCPLTQNGALRVMSQPAYLKPQPLNVLMPLLARSFADATHVFWPDDLSLTDAARIDPTHMHGHRQLTDIYLLALAVKHGGRLVTLDARIPLRAVRSAAPRHLVLIR